MPPTKQRNLIPRFGTINILKSHLKIHPQILHFRLWWEFAEMVCHHATFQRLNSRELRFENNLGFFAALQAAPLTQIKLLSITCTCNYWLFYKMITSYSRRHNLLFPLTKWFPPCRKKHWEVWEHFWVVVGLCRSRNVESVNKSEMVHSFNIKIVFCTGVSECVRFFGTFRRSE